MIVLIKCEIYALITCIFALIMKRFWPIYTAVFAVYKGQGEVKVMNLVQFPILYSFRRCPYAMRARMAVFVSGVEVELREIVLRNKPEAMLAVSPKGTVPVLVLPDGTVIDESLDIMHWALGQADPAQWLKPDAGETSALIEACDTDFKHHLDRYKYASRYEGAVAEEHRSEAERFLKQLEGRLEAQSYLQGPEPTLADYAIMPFIRQFANTDKAWFLTAPYRGVQKWLDGLLTSPPFTEVMCKYEPWQDGDATLVFGGTA